MPKKPLSIFKLDGSASDLTAYVNEPTAYEIRPSNTGFDGEAIFVFQPSQPNLSSWVPKVRSVFSNVPDLNSQTSRGLIVLRTAAGVFGIPFGTGGGSMLVQAKIVRNWGIRIALNKMYDDHGNLIGNGVTLRKEKTRQLDRGTNSEIQSGKEVSLNTLGFNQTREIMRAVTVKVDQHEWGSYVDGSDNFRLKWNGHYDELPGLCNQLESISQLADYTHDFGFIDNLKEVRDPLLYTTLWEEVAVMIKNGNISDLGILPTDLSDFVNPEWSILSISGKGQRGGYPMASLDLNAYISVLQQLNVIATLDGIELRKHKLRSREDDFEHDYSLFQWIEGTIELNGVSYIASEGIFYEVSDNFVKELDEFLDGIEANETYSPPLPVFNSVPQITVNYQGQPKQTRNEKAYNIAICNGTGRLMLDGNNHFKIAGRTEQVEFCDVLTVDKKLIHTKIGHQGSKLSHLFSQAMVSGEAFLDSKEFRVEMRRRIRKAAIGQGLNNGPLEAVVPLNLRDGRNHTIVFAIISKKWGNSTTGTLMPISSTLPFFAKINARIAIITLQNRSFQVEFARIMEN